MYPTGATAMTSFRRNNIQGIIDLGNADIKFLYRIGDDSDDWHRHKFESVVSTSPLVNNHPARVLLGEQSYLIGEEATAVQCDRTGNTDSGKVLNALPLTIHALIKAAGMGKPLSADLIFTCPSVKAYGSDIQTKLVGEHKVTLPPDDAALIDEQKQTIRIDSAIPQLEGYQAYRLVKSECPNGAVMVDIGSRTILVTVVDAQGRILNRFAKDDCGCHRIAERVYQSECLIGLKGMNQRLPNAEQVMAFLLDTTTKKSLRKQQATRIEPHVLACVQDAQTFVRQYGDKPVYLMGGGSMLPGMVNAFSDSQQKAQTMPEATWATLIGLSTVADRLFTQN